jgi:NAD(P)-dependent dehydrogenase (short-subunit alcohol dehydrogenase family)
LSRSIADTYDLTGRVAIITGAAGLLGRGYAHTLASAGAHVVLTDIDEHSIVDLAAEIGKQTDVETLGLRVDVADIESVNTMVAKTVEKFNRVDILVNNAAINPKFDQDHSGVHVNDFENFPLKAWQESIDVNITGMFLCAQAVTPPMREADKGVIVNVSSTYGMVGPDQRLYHREGEPIQYKPVTYTVSKAAAIGLTRYLATYFAGTGIRVNTLTPGGVFAGHDDEFVRRYSDRTVMGRMANREEMSSALLFLVSDASSYMTGSNLIVDGGWTAW